ncbi:MAG: discoidin domain-containing protein [Planctomycetes bacterium]|nr:discoidin domain-containing protein [Planctomycetota bacterium]
MASYLDDNNRYITPWYRMPQFNYYRVYTYGMKGINQKGEYAFIRSLSGLYIYHLPSLISYMENTVSTAKNCFTVATKASHLESAVDQNDMTYAVISGEDRCILGIDLGIPEAINALELVPRKQSAHRLTGAYIQYSTFSETGGFHNIHTIKADLKNDQRTTVSFTNKKKARYWRIVTRTGEPIVIGDLRFISK